MVEKIGDNLVKIGAMTQEQVDDVAKLESLGFLIKPVSLRKLQHLLDSILE